MKKGAQVVIRADLVIPIKKIQGQRLLKSTDEYLITFTNVVNDLLEEKIKELQKK